MSDYFLIEKEYFITKLILNAWCTKLFPRRYSIVDVSMRNAKLKM